MYVTKFHDTLDNENLLSNSRPSPLHCLQALPVILESSPYRIYLFRISSATMFPKSLWPQSRALPPVGPMPCTLYMRVYLSTREVAALSCEFAIPFCIVSESGSVRNHHFSSMTFVTSTRLCPNRYLWPPTRPTYTMGSSSLILGFTEALFCDSASIHFPPDSDEPSSDSPETLRPYTPHPTT